MNPVGLRTKTYPAKILVVDDNPGFLFGVSKTLSNASFSVITANDGYLGIEKAQTEHPDLILLDVDMPQIDGFDVKRALDKEPVTRNIPVVFLSAFNDRFHTLLGLNIAEDYISKPFDADILIARLQAIFRRQAIGYNLAIFDSKTSDFSIEQYREWGEAVEYQDYGTNRHTHRVTRLFTALSRALGLSESCLEIFQKGAMLHDIGKLAIPEKILNKPGPLNEEEWAIMKQHPLIAYKMLSSVETLKPVLSIPLFHHEHWDGNGYPYHLQENEIPLEARIFSVVDVFDALISRRPYKAGMCETEALEIISSQAGKQLDPSIVSFFLERFNSLKVVAQNGQS